jgi:hypothetical protein
MSKRSSALYRAGLNQVPQSEIDAAIEYLDGLLATGDETVESAVTWNELGDDSFDGGDTDLGAANNWYTLTFYGYAESSANAASDAFLGTDRTGTTGGAVYYFNQADDYYEGAATIFDEVATEWDNSWR